MSSLSVFWHLCIPKSSPELGLTANGDMKIRYWYKFLLPQIWKLVYVYSSISTIKLWAVRCTFGTKRLILTLNIFSLYFQTAFKLKLPVTGTIGLNLIVLVTAFVFTLPTEYFSLGRSYTNSAADERAFLYSNMESLLDRLKIYDFF